MAGVLLLLSCDEDSDFGTHEYGVGEALLYDRNLESSLFAYNHANLLDDFNLNGEFTVFAPTNEAWDAFIDSYDVYGSLNEFNGDFSPEGNSVDIRRVVEFMVVSGSFSPEELEGQTLTTRDGNTISVSNNVVSGGRNGNVDIIRVNTLAANGFIYVVDQVMISPDFQTESIYETLDSLGLTELEAALDRLPEQRDLLDGGAGAFTFVGPTNQAFQDYYATNGYASINDVPLAELETLIGNRIYPQYVGLSDLDANFTTILDEQANYDEELVTVFVGEDGEEFTLIRTINGWMYVISTTDTL